jgi:hypothetical protein
MGEPTFTRWGACSFEMLTGQLAFQSDSYEGWFEQHVHVTPPNPSQIRPELAEYPGLDALVLRLMAKERDDRPADVRVFLAELDRVIAAKGTGAASGANQGFGPAGGIAATGDLLGQNRPAGSGLGHATGLKPTIGSLPGGEAARLSKRARLIFRSIGAAVLLVVGGMILALMLRKDDTSTCFQTIAGAAARRRLRLPGRLRKPVAGGRRRRPGRRRGDSRSSPILRFRLRRLRSPFSPRRLLRR